MFHVIKLLFIPFACLSAVVLSSCSSESDYHKDEGVIWHTFWRVTFQGNKALSDSILPVLDRTGKSLSVFDDSSTVSKVNSTLDAVVDHDFIAVYNESLRINRITDNYFDPTLSPLITAWGFGKGHRATPDTCRIDSIMQFVGLSKTHLEGNRLVKDDIRTEFNFSAIAKGYGCDMVAAMFRRNNVENFLIEIGGEIVASGVSPKGEPWRVGIERPAHDMKDSQVAKLIIQLKDMALATSGNYRNYHVDAKGNRFAHTISVETGRPVQTDVISATVIAPECMQADALATSFMALGSKKSKQIAIRLNYPVLLILNDETIWMSDPMKKRVTE